MENKIIKDTKTAAHEAVKLLLEKQALGVKLYDMREKDAITEFYINATGKSSMHVASLADELCDRLAEYGKDALRVEGKRSDTWVLVDYGDIIVNVFDKQSRDFYDLDRLLPKETLVDITPLEKEVDAKFDIKKI